MRSTCPLRGFRTAARYSAGEAPRPLWVSAAAGPEIILAFAIGFFGVLSFADDLHRLSALRFRPLRAPWGTVATARLMEPVCLSVSAKAVLAMAATVWITGFVNIFNPIDGVYGIDGAHALIAGAAGRGYGEWLGQRYCWPRATLSP
jgi:UDP-GlcNAc:undecaprenyl-phosphate/decaprenyl-phosphate GlcNAc-1-phosphate transferase